MWWDLDMDAMMGDSPMQKAVDDAVPNRRVEVRVQLCSPLFGQLMGSMPDGPGAKDPEPFPVTIAGVEASWCIYGVSFIRGFATFLLEEVDENNNEVNDG